MTSLRGALNLETPSDQLLSIYGDVLRQQHAVQFQHGRGIGPVAPAHAQGAAAATAPDQPDQANQADQQMVDRWEGHGPAGPPEVEPTYTGAENDPLPLLADGQGRRSPRKKHGEAMKEGVPASQVEKVIQVRRKRINGQCPG